MRIQTFSNMKGLIFGSDPKRIGCDKEGVLKIGSTEITVTPEKEAILPLLFNGGTGEYPATFTDVYGAEYELEKVSVQSGRITPPPPTSVEMMELRCRADAAEKMNEVLMERIKTLEGIFDTNSLNFLIR